MLQVVAEKSKYTQIDVVLNIISMVEEVYPDMDRTLIIYSERAMPLVDYWYESRYSLTDSYSEAPFLPGRPNPGPALVEAVDQVESTNPTVSSWKIMLLWSARSRPRHIELYISYALDSGASLYIIALRPSIPPWLSGLESDTDITVKRIRKNTNIRKLVTEIVG